MNKSFEESEKNLKKICEKLEAENCSISETLEMYEQGALELKNCFEILNTAKGKVTKINMELDNITEVDM